MKAFENRTTGIIGALEIKKMRYKILYGCIIAILSVISIISIVPSIWVLLSGFKSVKEIYQIPPEIFPKEIRLSKLYEVWKLLKLGKSCIGEVAFGVIFPALGGYVISRLRPKGSKLVMSLLLWTMMMPGSIRTVPLFMIFNDLPVIHISLIGTYFPIWLSAGANIFTTLLFKNNFDAISISLIEAARIDGATNFQVFMKINLPLSRPIIVYTALSSFTWPWSDFILPKLLLKEKNLYTVAVGLMSLDETEFARFAAGSVFIAVPIVLLYFFLVKDMVNGMAAGAVKG